MRHKKVSITIEGAPLATVPAGIAYAVDKPKDVSLSYVFDDGRKPVTQYRHPVTGEIVEKRPSTRGKATGKKDEHGEILTVVPGEQWDAINEKAKLNITGFVPRSALARRVDRVCDVHYIQVQEGFDAAALAMISEGLLQTDTAAVCEFSVGGRERLGVLFARSDGTMAVATLLYEEHLREPDEAVRAVAAAEPREELVEAVVAMIEANTVDDVEALDEKRDENLAKRRELLDRVLAGEIVADESAEPVEDTSLADALAASLAAATKPKGKAKGKQKAKAAA